MQFRIVIIHEHNGILVHGCIEGRRISSITSHLGKCRRPASKRIGVLCRSSLCRIGGLYDVGGSSAIVVLRRSLQNRAVLIHEGHRVLVGRRGVGRRIGHIAGHVSQRWRPTSEGVGHSIVTLFCRVGGLYDIVSSSAIVVLRRSLQNRAVLIHEGHRVLVNSLVNHSRISCRSSHSHNLGIPADKRIAVLIRIGESLALGSRRHSAVFHLGSSFRAIAIHKRNGVLVHRRGIRCRISSITSHLDKCRRPASEGISIFSRSSLLRVGGLYDVGGSSAIVVLRRSLQNRSVLIHEGHRVLVQGRRISRYIGDIVNHIHKFRRPTRKFISKFRISSLRGSRRLYNICGQSSKIILHSFFENRSQIVIHKGYRELSLGSYKLSRIIGILRNSH